MKNYIANEDGEWDTSKALIRRRLLECIDMGRRYRKSDNKAEQYEAFRLLGTAMHTMEDFPAHSNFCELSLISMGHQQVFTHVGDSVRIKAPNGNMVAPLVTGECLWCCWIRTDRPSRYIWRG
jgi:Heterokaryon incompatibility protein Het-C